MHKLTPGSCKCASGCHEICTPRDADTLLLGVSVKAENMSNSTPEPELLLPLPCERPRASPADIRFSCSMLLKHTHLWFVPVPQRGRLPELYYSGPPGHSADCLLSCCCGPHQDCWWAGVSSPPTTRRAGVVPHPTSCQELQLELASWVRLCLRLCSLWAALARSTPCLC